MPAKSPVPYKNFIQRMFERLGVDKGIRSPEEDEKIKTLILEASAKEILAFIWEHLFPFERKVFEKDLEKAGKNFKSYKEVEKLISSYLSLIPNWQVRLQQRLELFEAAFLQKLLERAEEK